MKIIQSFWSLPMRAGSEDVENNRFCGGWLDWQYLLMSWAYSCLRLRSCYNEVGLVTDRAGKSLLIDDLQLPYTSVDVVLDELNDYGPEWWAIGKLYTVSKQQQPFIHVDGDVFIWEKFPPRIENAPLVAQNLEFDYPFYRSILTALNDSGCVIPAAIRDNGCRSLFLNAFNAGIIGGNAVPFLREYAKEAFAFVQINQSALCGFSSGLVNAFYEQHLYYCLARERNIAVECYTPITDMHAIDEQMKGLNRFKSAPAQASYIHLFGEDAKKNPAICAELEAKLSREYPEYFAKVLRKVHQHRKTSLSTSHE